MDSSVLFERVLAALVVLAAAAVAVLVLMWFIGRAGRRAGWSGGRVALAQWATPLVLLAGASVAFDAAGAVGRGVVEHKDERISYGARIPGNWHRSFWASVRLQTPDGPAPSLLWLDDATFDALGPGTTLDVKYLPAFPLVARPTTVSTWSLVPWSWMGVAVTVLVVGRAIWRGLRRREALRAAVVLVSALAGVVVWVFPTPWDPALEPPIVRGMAEVRAIRDVTTSFVSGRRTGHVDAPQPWQVVELQFVPEGREQPVIAIDGVDVDSVEGLAVGARVPIAYSAKAPRDVRLDGERTYRWREWLELGEELLLVVAAVAAVALMSKVAKTLWWYVTTVR